MHVNEKMLDKQDGTENASAAYNQQLEQGIVGKHDHQQQPVGQQIERS